MPSRRDLIKSGLVLGGAMSAPHFARGQFCPPQANPPTPASPATTPFVWPMPIMPVAQPVDASVLRPAPDPSTHQRYNEFPPKKFYNIDVKAVMQKFHPDLPASVLFGYNGQVPGPTFHCNYGEPLLIRFNNNLPTDHVGFGIPSISTHMHNFHTASESDGYPADFNDAGTYRDHHYCAFPAGNDPAQIMNTLVTVHVAASIFLNKSRRIVYCKVDECENGSPDNTARSSGEWPSALQRAQP